MCMRVCVRVCVCVIYLLVVTILYACYSCVCTFYLHITHCIVFQSGRTCHSGSWSHSYGHTAVGVSRCHGNEHGRELQVTGELHNCGKV